MSNTNDYSNNTYKSAIQREMRKVNVNSGCRCDFNGQVGNRAAAELIRNILIDNGVCDYVTENGILPDNINNISNNYNIDTNRRRIERTKRTICDFPQELTFEEESLILRAVEREREDNIIENIAVTENTENIENIRSRRRQRGCICCRMQRGRRNTEYNRNRNNITGRAAIRAEFAENTDYTNTNVYRFTNQNFLDNLTGKSNIDISNLNNNPVQRRIQIEEILKKHGKI